MEFYKNSGWASPDRLPPEFPSMLYFCMLASDKTPDFSVRLASSVIPLLNLPPRTKITISDSAQTFWLKIAIFDHEYDASAIPAGIKRGITSYTKLLTARRPPKLGRVASASWKKVSFDRRVRMVSRWLGSPYNWHLLAPNPRQIKSQRI